MSTAHLTVEESDLRTIIDNMTPGTKVFFHVPKAVTNQLQMLEYKREGLNNVALSYINNTYEHAKPEFFEQFVDRVAQLEMELDQLKTAIAMQILGDHIYRYVARADSGLSLEFDMSVSVMTIEHKQQHHGHHHSH